MTNAFTNLANSPTQENALAASGVISDIAKKKYPNILNPDGTITQTERLFTTRARYASASLIDNGVSDLGGGRGQWAYIKLLTSDKQYSEYLSGSTSRQVTYGGLLGNNSLVAKMAQTGEGEKTGYDRFMITGVSCDMNEKVQITEVFGDGEVIYYFGRQPLIFTIRGMLVDSIDNNWFVDWIKMYSEFLRGSQTAKNYELLKLVLPNMELTGTIPSFSWQQDATRDTDIMFTFQFIAKLINPIAVAQGPVVNTNRVRGIDFTKRDTTLPQADINRLKGTVEDLSVILQSSSSSLRDKAGALSQLGSGVEGSFYSFLNDSKGTLDSYRSTIEGWTKEQNSYFNSIQTSALYQSVTSSLNGIRTNLFSPIYGILSSLTKLVSNTLNSATNIFLGATTPVRNILRDITSISNKAISLVNLVNNSISSFGRNVNNELRGIDDDFRIAISTLGKAAGTIATAPLTVSNSLANMFSNGALSANASFLALSPKPTFLRPSLNITGSAPKPRVQLLTESARYSSKTSNSL